MIRMNQQKKQPNIQQQLGLNQQAKRNKRLKIMAVILVALLLALIGTTFLATRSSHTPVSYRSQKTEKSNLTITVTATGTLEPTNQVDVGVEVSGTIETVEVDFNDRVQAGQVLARLDTSKLQAQVLQAKAALDSARAKVLRTRADVRQTSIKLGQLQQARKSSGGKVPSQVEMDAAEAALDRANADEASSLAEVSKTRAELEFSQTNLSKAIITSPISGIILNRRVEPGQTVAASLQTPILFTIAEDLSHMELHVAVDEADVGKVKEGQEAKFSVDAYPEQRFPARVAEVRFSPKTVEGVVTYETVLEVDNPKLILLPGMTATADIVVQKLSNVLLIPNAALRFTPPRNNQPETKKKNRGMLEALLPHRKRPAAADKEENNMPKNQRRVWTLRRGKPVPVTITTGVTDGQMTQVLNGNITPDMDLLTDIVAEEK
ncbi:MAG: efflux RND transporter periplasmic adaptor subunit [Xanthomonadaceae bacterium]|nr:efflux RND transporter periplasmic adaptor subunit [Xanthomonadaceae bacterium]